MSFKAVYKMLSIIICFVITVTAVGCNNSKPSEEIGTVTLSDGITEFVPVKTDEVLLNPDMGWILLDTAEEGRQDMGRSGLYPLIQTVGILTGWSQLEPQEGRFDWSTLDETIDFWVKNGKRIQFRISTDCFPYYGSSYACPQWVYDYGVDYQTKVDWSNQTVKYPDYNNPIYREKLSAFLKAYADKYSSLNELDFVDLRGYGEWGEWHSGYAYEKLEDRLNALKWIMDEWCNAWDGRKRLMLSYSHETEYGVLKNGTLPSSYDEYLSYSAFDYAVESYSSDILGFRRDGVAGAILDTEERFSNELYKANRLQVAEFCSAYNFYSARGIPIKGCIDQALMLHPNYIVMMGSEITRTYESFYEEEIENIKYALRKMGYRMVLRNAKYKSEAKIGEKISVSTEWQNASVGILPDGYSAEVILTDKNAKTVFSAPLNGFVPSEFINKNPVNATADIDTSKLSKGKYTLAYAVLDKNGQPIFLPHNGRLDNGFYTLGKLTVK